MTTRTTKKNIISAIFLASILAIAACGGDKKKGEGPTPAGGENTTESYSYCYSEKINGLLCTTGKHSFNSKEAYCTALLDEELNKGCLKEIREETHEAQCGGVEEVDLNNQNTVSNPLDECQREEPED